MGEAGAIIMVKNLTSVPVAQVLSAYMIEKIGFILMKKIHGCQIGESWPKLPRALKHSISQELKSYIQQWRQIEGSFLGLSIAAHTRRSFSNIPRKNKIYNYGPFASRKDFNKGMVETLARPRPNLTLETEQGILFAEELLMSGTDQEVKIFTHGDLDQSNIMIRDGKITGIFDWGAAGYSVPESVLRLVIASPRSRVARTLYVYPTARWI